MTGMKRSKVTGVVCTAALHLAVLALLFLLKFSVPQEQEEGGVPVMLGDAESGTGEEEAYSLTEVDVMPAPEEASEAEVDDRPMISQEDDSPMKVEKETEKKKEEAKEPETEAVKKPKEKTEAEKRAEAERAMAQAAANKIAGAFGKGSKMGAAGDGHGTHRQGSAAGNSSEGKPSGTGGIGVYDLQGRSLGTGALPVPVYNVQDEGRVVVTIVVNPEGAVIRTSINKRTNTVNPALRRAALEAAQKARFNAVDGVDNQSGTITYYFKLK